MRHILHTHTHTHACTHTRCLPSLTGESSLDEMGKRVDDLEKNIRDLMEQVDTKEDPAATDTAAGRK